MEIAQMHWHGQVPVQTHVVLQSNPISVGAGHTVVPERMGSHKDEFRQWSITFGAEILPGHRFPLTAKILFELPVAVMPTAARKRTAADRAKSDTITRSHIAATLSLSPRTPATRAVGFF